MSPPVPREGKKEGEKSGEGKKGRGKSLNGGEKVGMEAKKSKQRGKSQNRGEKVEREGKKSQEEKKKKWSGKIPGGEKIGEEKTDIRSLEGKNPRRGKFC